MGEREKYQRSDRVAKKLGVFSEKRETWKKNLPRRENKQRLRRYKEIIVRTQVVAEEDPKRWP